MKRSQVITLLIMLAGMLVFVGGLFYVNRAYPMPVIAGTDLRTAAFPGKTVLYIDTAADLRQFAEDVNNGNSFYDTYVVLTQDIDLEFQPFTPIGFYDSGNYFYGVFDGNGHTIRNLFVNLTDPNSNNGLFGCLGGIVCNVVLENPRVEGYVCGAFCSIAIGQNSAILNSRIVNPEITGEYTDIVGGQYYGTRSNCFIDDEMDLSTLQENLTKTSALGHNISMNTWEMTDGGLQMTNEKANSLYDLSLHINSDSFSGTLSPFYMEDSETYYFVLPFSDMQGSGSLTALYQDGISYSQEVSLLEESSLTVHYPVQDLTNQQSFSDSAPADVKIQILCSDNTASIFLNMDNTWPMTYIQASKDNNQLGEIHVFDENGSLNYFGSFDEFHGRGNDSWAAAKKSYSLGLDQNANLLDMGAERDFVLIAGYRDSSLLTYEITNDLSKEIGMEFAPLHNYVNLYVNGEYLGLYFLTERIETGTNRIDISMNTNDITGGYIYELDVNDYADAIYRTSQNSGNIYVIRAPKIVSEEEIVYSTDLWNDVEEAIYSPDGYNAKGQYYADLIDIDSFSKQYLIYELGSEISIASSVYFYKESDLTGDGLIHAVYPWDMEHSYTRLEERAGYSCMLDLEPEAANGFWFALYQHPDFQDALADVWSSQFHPAISKLLEYNSVYDPDGISSITHYVNEHRKAFSINEIRWGSGQNVFIKGNSIRNWMAVKVPFLDAMLLSR